VIALFDAPAPLPSALKFDSEYLALVEEGASGKLNVAARHAAVSILQAIKVRDRIHNHPDTKEELTPSIAATTNRPLPHDRQTIGSNAKVSPPLIAGENNGESRFTTAPQPTDPIPPDVADLRWPTGWDQTTRLRLARIIGGGKPPLIPSQQQEVIDALVTRQKSRTKPPLHDMGAYALELCQRQRNGTFNPPVPGAPLEVSTPDPIREQERREREVRGEIRALESMAQESERRHGQNNVTTSALREQIVKLRAELVRR
jgi:hypothetical protein